LFGTTIGKQNKLRIPQVVALDGRWSTNYHTTTNRKQVSMIEESMERVRDWGGSVGDVQYHHSIVILNKNK
jgi:hypothetical protein